MGALETIKHEVSRSPERPLQRTFWTYLGTFGAQPAEDTLELQCPGSPSLMLFHIQMKSQTIYHSLKLSWAHEVSGTLRINLSYPCKHLPMSGTR